MADEINRIGLGVDIEGGETVLGVLREIRREMVALTSGLGNVSRTTSNLGRRYSSGSRSGTSSDNPDQGRLFGDSSQQNLFTRAELDKTRIVERETKKRGQIKSQQLTEEEQQLKRIGRLYEENQRKQRIYQAEKAYDEKNIARTSPLERKFQTQERLEANRQRSAEAQIRKDEEGKQRLKDYYSSKNIERIKTQGQAERVEIKRQSKLSDDAEMDALRKAAVRSRASSNPDAVSKKNKELLLAGGDDFLSPAMKAQLMKGLNPSDLAEYNRTIKKQLADSALPQIDKMRDSIAKTQSNLLSSKQFNSGGPFVFGEFDRLRTRLVELRAELVKPSSMKMTRDKVTAELKDIQIELNRAIERNRAFKTSVNERNFFAGGSNGGRIPPVGRGPSGGGNNPNNPPNLNSQLYNEKGFFTSVDMVGRISRNILLYQVVSQATYGLMDYVKASVMAVRAADDIGRALEFASKSAESNASSNLALAESLRGFGASRQQGRLAVTEGARFIEGVDRDPTRLVNLATNIAASRGEGIDKVDELIEQLRRGESKFFKRQFGKSVEQLYRDEAQRQAAPYEGQTIQDESGKVISQTDYINKLVASMSEATKERIRYNFILSQEGKFTGEAARRSQELAGKMDTLYNRALDAQEGIGLFISEIRILNTLVDKATGLFDRLSVSSGKLAKTGPGGITSGYDIERYVADRTNTTRQGLLDTVNNYGGTAIAGLIGAGAFSFLGRRPATNNLRDSVYKAEYTRAYSEMGSQTAAVNQAASIAREARPGLTKTITTGMQRVTIGLNESLRGLYDWTTGKVRTEASAKSIWKPLGVSGSDYAANQQFYDGMRQRGREIGGTSVGLLGSALGAQAGAMTADKLQVGALTATAMTVLGGVGGNILGTAIGNVPGGAIGARLAAAGGLTKALAGLGIGAGAAIAGAGAAAIGAPILAYSNYQSRVADAQLRREEVRSVAYAQQAAQRNLALKEDRVRFYDNRPGASLEELTTPQIAEMIAKGLAKPGDFREVIIEIGEKARRDADKAFLEGLSKNQGLPTEAFQNVRNEFWQRADEYSRKRDEERLKREEDKRQERIEDQSRALAKLREFGQGSFRLVEDMSISLTGQDNPFTKIISDQETLAFRMQEQWGWRGKAEVEFQKKLEKTRLNMALVNASFDSFGRAMELTNQRLREQQERNGPGFTTRQNLVADVAQAGLANINTQLDGFKRELEIRYRGNLTGTYFDQRTTYGDPSTRIVKDTVSQINRNSLFAYGLGGNSRQLSEITSQAIIDATRELTPEQISRDPYLKEQVLGAINNQRLESMYKIRDGMQRVQMDVWEENLLNQNLAQAASKRNSLLSQGLDANMVGQAYDRFVIGRTDNISAKDMTSQQFAMRQDALKREADREVAREAEARAAVQKGLLYQKMQLEETIKLRAAIIGGDAKVLLQILNDSEARIDKEALENMNGAGFNVPLNNTTGRQNPYQGLGDKYGRGGNKR